MECKGLRYAKRSAGLPMTRAFGDAIALGSPSGHISKRALKAAQERIRKQLFPEGLAAPKGPEVSERVRLLWQAAELRGLAARGMKPRAFVKKAKELEVQAEALKEQGV